MNRLLTLKFSNTNIMYIIKLSIITRITQYEEENSNLGIRSWKIYAAIFVNNLNEESIIIKSKL